MRVAHLNTEKTFRGGERQVVFLIKGLTEKNVTSYLICNKDSKIKGVVSNFLNPENIFEVKMNGEYDIFAILKIREFLKINRVNIVHCHTSHAHTLGYFASIGLNTKVLVSRRVDFSIYRKGIRFLSLAKYNLFCDKIISISQTIKEILIKDKVIPNKITTVHSGVEILPTLSSEDYADIIDEFKINMNYLKIVNVAALEEHKGQSYLIEAFAKVLSVYPQTLLIIVGDGKLSSSLKNIAKNLKIDNKIIFTGFRKDVIKFLNIADIFTISSLDEGLCTSILDAVSLNKVVVATNAGGIPEIIKNRETGILVEKGNVDSLADGLIYAIRNFKHYKKKFSSGSKFISRNFSVENMVNGNFLVYKQLLKNDSN